jgi:hypothetical protein
MRYAIAGIFAILLAHVAVLYFMGQPFMYEGGYIKLWHGIVISDENSQHLFDWYSLSHVIHGMLFYLGLTLFFPRLSIGSRLILALCIEAGWEFFENTDLIINRYREQALAQGYFGDSIVNSLGDMLAALVGFLAAWRLPFFGTLILVVVLEMLALYFIRDSLTFNVIQLIHPVDWIGEWQSR